ncbi:dTMP kinase [Oleispira antarctica]|uniref:Thymidylate kinase n=1 Tax=Oleispira antarctica TaxID=188908 RepID=A0A1Y5HGW3_OLEAN|nr:dTMP kinase [Oleispira antarctica]
MITNTRLSNALGQFITFEGGEGVGKSTNIEYCRQLLEQKGLEVIVTREPGGTEIAEIIREELLKKPHQERMSDITELLLVFAARAQHVEALVKPALERGCWVLCDRFTDSTIAYQGYGRGLEVALIEQLKLIAQQGIEPDKTFLLDAPVDVGMSRARARGPADRFEVEQLDFFNRVREGFLAIAEKSSDRVQLVNAAQTLERVQADLEKALAQLLATESN